MPVSRGIVGPIVYKQGDNTGEQTGPEIMTLVKYTPQEFGAPEGAQVLPESVIIGVQGSENVGRIQNVDIQADSVSFQVCTRRSKFPGEHCDGEISVSTTFEWQAK
jgi:hypothetical protein